MAAQRTEKGEAPMQVRAHQGFLIQKPDKERIMVNSTQIATNRAITVPFHGAELYVVEHNSQPYTPMKPIITGMGLTWHGQHAKIKANTRRWGVLELRIPSSGGLQDMLCMPLRKLPGWLSGIEAGKVKSEEARSNVVNYQNECDDVLWQYWNDGIAINPRMAYSVLPDQTISDKQAETLRLLLTENVKKLPKEKQGGAMVKGWSKLKAHFKTDYRHIPAVEFHEAVNILARHVAEWEVVDEAPKDALLTDTIERLARQLTTGNGAPVELFMPLYDAICAKLARRGMVLLRPGQIVVDSQKLAAVWFDLGKLRNRIDGLGVVESDLPPSWWKQNAIASA